jgi:glycosyltransferase involved in cell wall biosynthesis
MKMSAKRRRFPSHIENHTDKVSIVIPFYNCSYVDKAIMSALKQTYKNIEIIVVDDGSTIHLEKLRPFMGKINYIRKENGGTATALNEGIRRASGEYFVWLSSDDELHPSKVESQLHFMKQQNAFISFTNFNWINKNNSPIRLSVSPKFPNKVSLYNYMKKGCPINGSTIMIKLDLFSDVGLFNEKMIYTHDYDLWNRIIIKYNIPFLDQSLTNYRIHDDMGSKRNTEAIKREVDSIKKTYRQKLDQLIANATSNRRLKG